MIRVSALILLTGAGLLFTPGTAPAQFGPRHGGFGGPVIVPSFNPFFYVPQYRYSYGTQLNFNGPIGNFSYSSRQYYYGVDPYPAYLYSTPAYLQSGSYMTGGASVRPDLGQQTQRAISQGQRAASLPDAKDQITGQWNYENGAVAGANGAGQGQLDALRKALTAPDPADIASGDALNEVLKEIIRVEAKGAKGTSAYIPALLLNDMRFAGSPAADLLNFARQAGSLEIPTAFDDPALAALRAELERDFAAAAVAVQAGKAPEAAKVTKVEVTFQRMQEAAGPVVKNLPFEDAAAARRFLNRMASAIKAMKGNTANGLIDPKWSVEGLTVADLVKHMTRHKLFFGAAPRGSEEAYAAMHRNLVTYLFVLTQPKK